MALNISKLMIDMETIGAFTVAPWHLSTTQMVNITTNRETAAKKCADARGTELQMFTDGSWKNGTVGYSVVVWMDGMVKNHRQRTIGLKDQVNVYIAELAAIIEAVDLGVGFARAERRMVQRHHLLG